MVQFSELYYENASRFFFGQALTLNGGLPALSEEVLARLDSLLKGSAVAQGREARLAFGIG